MRLFIYLASFGLNNEWQLLNRKLCNFFGKTRQYKTITRHEVVKEFRKRKNTSRDTESFKCLLVQLLAVKDQELKSESLWILRFYILFLIYLKVMIKKSGWKNTYGAHFPKFLNEMLGIIIFLRLAL